MKQIHEYLGVSEEYYQNMKLQLFLNWAEGYSGKCTDWQGIIANSAISRWFNLELSVLEKDFIEQVKAYEDTESVTVLHYKNVYNRCTVDIHSLFPKPLLDEAKKIPNQIHTMRSNGVVLFTYLNSN